MVNHINLASFHKVGLMNNGVKSAAACTSCVCLLLEGGKVAIAELSEDTEQYLRATLAGILLLPSLDKYGTNGKTMFEADPTLPSAWGQSHTSE